MEVKTHAPRIRGPVRAFRVENGYLPLAVEQLLSEVTQRDPRVDRWERNEFGDINFFSGDNKRVVAGTEGGVVTVETTGRVHYFDCSVFQEVFGPWEIELAMPHQEAASFAAENEETILQELAAEAVQFEVPIREVIGGGDPWRPAQHFLVPGPGLPPGENMISWLITLQAQGRFKAFSFPPTGGISINYDGGELLIPADHVAFVDDDGMLTACGPAEFEGRFPSHLGMMVADQFGAEAVEVVRRAEEAGREAAGEMRPGDPDTLFQTPYPEAEEGEALPYLLLRHRSGTDTWDMMDLPTTSGQREDILSRMGQGHFYDKSMVVQKVGGGPLS